MREQRPYMVTCLVGEYHLLCLQESFLRVLCITYSKYIAAGNVCKGEKSEAVAKEPNLRLGAICG